MKYGQFKTLKYIDQICIWFWDLLNFHEEKWIIVFLGRKLIVLFNWCTLTFVFIQPEHEYNLSEILEF